VRHLLSAGAGRGATHIHQKDMVLGAVSDEVVEHAGSRWLEPAATARVTSSQHASRPAVSLQQYSDDVSGDDVTRPTSEQSRGWSAYESAQKDRQSDRSQLVGIVAVISEL